MWSFCLHLINVNHHKSTTDFTDKMYSHGLFPMIIKASRITTNTATFINNIFTYDHLTVFAFFQDFKNYLA